MFAVVDIAGFQEKVAVGDTLKVPKLAGEIDKTMTFEHVYMIVKDDGASVIGTPFVQNASVEVKVVEHGKDKKIRMAKMRRRKRYLRFIGHRQQYTCVEVTGIKGV